MFFFNNVNSGPSGSFYENGFFIADLSFPQTYPMDPPKMKFTTKIIHPNSISLVVNPAVYKNGSVCISILHVSGDDPFGYEDRLERWSPVISIEKILICILNMLCGYSLKFTFRTKFR
uniref:Ubiquitin-conjugating enzyme E2 15 (Trinotate prediction) n=1 Tax=Myxobolus squamalis TaxID=59785 RepID=A0A6B2G1S6_MYXSQ